MLGRKTQTANHTFAPGIWHLIKNCALAGVMTSSLVAIGFEGFVVSELPKGGDVTVPGDVKIRVPPRTHVSFFNSERPQTLTLGGIKGQNAQVWVLGSNDKRPRSVTIKPGAKAVYTFKHNKPIRLVVGSGEVEVTSLWPLKILR